jgi:hypothetical protein
MADIQCNHNWKFMKESTMIRKLDGQKCYLIVFYCSICRELAIDGYLTVELENKHKEAVERLGAES